MPSRMTQQGIRLMEDVYGYWLAQGLLDCCIELRSMAAWHTWHSTASGHWPDLTYASAIEHTFPSAGANYYF